MEETMKKKYARVVFEEEISESATEEEVEEIMRNVIRNFESYDRLSIDDIEIYETPYTQNGCDNDKIEEERECKKITVADAPSITGGVEIKECSDLKDVCNQCNLPLFSIEVFRCKETQMMFFTYYERKILYSYVKKIRCLD